VTNWVIVGPTVPFKGGVSQHTTELARRLSSHGEGVTLLSWLRQYPKRLYPGTLVPGEPDGIPFENTERVLSWNRPDTWVRVGLRLRRQTTFNVFVGVTPFQYPLYLIMLLVAGKRARSRSVVVAHNVIPHEASSVDRLFTKLLFRAVRGVLTHSPDEKRRAEELGADAEYSPLPFHFPGEVRRRESREPTRDLLFLGFVRPYKGLDLLFEAISKIEPPVRLTVAGEFWEPEAKYVQLAEHLGITSRVTIINRYISTSEMVQLLHAHDALMLPYRSATGSQLPQIANACGVPVVATPVGSFPEQLALDARNIVVEAVGVSSILDGIIEVLTSNSSDEIGNSPPDAIRVGWTNYIASINACIH